MGDVIGKKYRKQKDLKHASGSQSAVDGWAIKAVLQWYRWQCCWAEMIDGLIGIITLGYVRLDLSMIAVKIAARKRHEAGKPL